MDCVHVSIAPRCASRAISSARTFGRERGKKERCFLRRLGAPPPTTGFSVPSNNTRLTVFLWDFQGWTSPTLIPCLTGGACVVASGTPGASGSPDNEVTEPATQAPGTSRSAEVLARPVHQVLDGEVLARQDFNTAKSVCKARRYHLVNATPCGPTTIVRTLKSRNKL